MSSTIKITDKGVDISNIPRIVQGEENADILTFETDRFYNDIDLSGTTISILFKNKLGTFCDIATRKVINESKLQFSWAISKNATACIGALTVGIEFNSITSNNVVTVKTVRFPVNIEPGISSEDISGNAPGNWFEKINTKVDNLETAIKNKVDKNTVATTTQMGMIQLYSSASGVNRSGLVVDPETGIAVVNTKTERGITRDGLGQIQINPATDAEVASGTEAYKPVTPKTLRTITSYSAIPTQIGTWIDGTPIWRVAFSLTESELFAKNPALWDDRCITFNDLVAVRNLNGVEIITNYAIYASQAAPCIVDSANLSYDGNIGFNFGEGIQRGIHDCFYGFVEFATPVDNLIEGGSNV